MKRRTFLGQAAAAPLIFGLPGLFGQDAKASPDWYAAALKRMKESGRPGVVVVLPADAAGRQRIGAAVWKLVSAASGTTQELLCEAVFIFMTPDLAAGRVRADGEKADRFLLDPEGKRVEADSIDPSFFDFPRAFADSFIPFVRGKDNERFEVRLEAARLRQTDEVRAAFGKLDADEYDVREAADKVLRKSAGTIIPCLIRATRVGESVELRARAGGILESYFKSFKEDEPGPRLPYGAYLPKLVNWGCGSFGEEPEAGSVDEGRPRPACGMARMIPASRSFVRFLVK